MSGSLSVFRDMFGEGCVDFSDDKNISVTVDGKTILVCLETRVRSRTEQYMWCTIVVVVFLSLSVWLPPDQSVCYEDECTEDDSLREMVDLAVQRLYEALNPVIWEQRQNCIFITRSLLQIQNVLEVNTQFVLCGKKTKLDNVCSQES